MSQFLNLKTIGFRNLKDNQSIFFDHKLNFILGENGAGKSNLIEALHFFSHSRSFRHSPIEQIIKKNHNSFTLVSNVLQENEKIQLGVSRDIFSDITLKINKQKASKYSDLASKIAVKTLSTDKSNQLDLSPKFRRAEIDWQLFHMKHKNLQLFSELNLVLKNKNTLLKKTNSDLRKIKDEAEPWNFKLAELSVLINQKRKEVIEKINSELKNLISEKLFKEVQDIVVGFNSGFPKALDDENEKHIFQFLMNHLDSEYKMNQSLYGPQRADILFSLKTQKETTLKDFFSRGEKKLISLYFSLAQINALKKINKNAVLCIDDAHAELDSSNFGKLIILVSKMDIQSIISIPKKSFVRMKKFGKTFNVNDGKIIEV